VLGLIVVWNRSWDSKLASLIEVIVGLEPLIPASTSSRALSIQSSVVQVWTEVFLGFPVLVSLLQVDFSLEVGVTVDAASIDEVSPDALWNSGEVSWYYFEAISYSGSSGLSYNFDRGVSRLIRGIVSHLVGRYKQKKV
jgi:hypothetical protein